MADASMERKQSLNFNAEIRSRPAPLVDFRFASRRAGGMRLLGVAAICIAMAGCSGPRKQTFPETFSDTNTYSRTYPAPDGTTCEAARRALLSQGYTIGKAQTDGVEGQKNFQVEDDKHQVISFHVVCTSDQQETPHTTVFVNAVQDRYIIKKNSTSAGVGLSVLGSVQMPFGSSDDSLSKISSETITAPSFYDGFFDLLQRYLPKSKGAPAAQSKAPAKPPAAVPASAAPVSPASSSAPPPSPASSPSPSAAPPSSSSSSAPTSTSTSSPAPTTTPTSPSSPAPMSTPPSTSPAPSSSSSAPGGTGAAGANAGGSKPDDAQPAAAGATDTTGAKDAAGDPP
jgi:hypothetical protein